VAVGLGKVVLFTDINETTFTCAGPVVGRLDRFDAIGHRAHGGIK
jgi:hypothetical protein